MYVYVYVCMTSKLDKGHNIASITLNCQRCKYNWNYTGKAEWVTSCPRCKTSVMVNQNNEN